MSPLVEFQAVSLTYLRSRHTANTLKSATLGGLFKRHLAGEEWEALNGICFQIEAGDVLAVLGRNGAGKSSLLKLIAQILPPTSGRVLVNASVAPVIELGAGFNFELSAAENAVLYGALLGRRPVDVRSRLPKIAEWAGLQDQMDLSLRTYSSGMLARLAFAVATDEQADLVLLDETLSVGDTAFRKQSAERTQSLIAQGSAAVLVTHEMDLALSLGTKGLWLEKGSVAAFGEIEEVVADYQRSFS